MPSLTVSPGISGCRRVNHTITTIEMRNAPENCSPPCHTANIDTGSSENSLQCVSTNSRREPTMPSTMTHHASRESRSASRSRSLA